MSFPTVPGTHELICGQGVVVIKELPCDEDGRTKSQIGAATHLKQHLSMSVKGTSRKYEHDNFYFPEAEGINVGPLRWCHFHSEKGGSIGTKIIYKISDLIDTRSMLSSSNQILIRLNMHSINWNIVGQKYL